MANAKHIPAGWAAVIPRIAVDDAEGLVGFIQHVFGAVGCFQQERPSELPPPLQYLPSMQRRRRDTF